MDAKKIKGFQVNMNSKPYPNMVSKFTPPKFTRKTEEFRAGDMDTPVEIDLGGEKLEATIVWEENSYDVMDTYGACNDKAVKLRLSASAENESCDYDKVEIYLEGRFMEIDRGDFEAGSNTQMTTRFAASIYAEYLNNKEKIYIDKRLKIHRVNGKDRLAKRREAMGMTY